MRSIAPLFVLASFCAGCSYYDSSLLDPTGGSAGDAGSDTSPETGFDAFNEADVGDATPDGPADVANDPPVDGDAPETTVCVHSRPPDPPPVTGAGGNLEVLVAVRGVDFGDQNGNAKELGYDLDSRCTCQGEANGCLRGSWATADGCDGPEGRDNMAGAFITEMSVLFSAFSSEEWSQAAEEGTWSLMLRVRNYNGLPDDDQVRLDWYVTDQYWEDKPDDSYLPAWDGTDSWPIRSSSLIDQGGSFDLDHPKYYDEHAYVSGGVLVGSLTETSIQIGADYALEMNGAFITATLEQEDAGWNMKGGLLAARWKLSSILGQISRIKDPVFDLPLCTNHPVYPNIKQKVCAYTDIYSGVGAPTTPCDSMSAAMRFDMVPAAFGDIVNDPPEDPACETNVNPSFDTCDDL